MEFSGAHCTSLLRHVITRCFHFHYVLIKLMLVLNAANLWCGCAVMSQIWRFTLFLMLLEYVF